MSSDPLDEAYVRSVDEFLSAVPDSFFKTLREKITQNKENEALDLACQYIVKFFSYIPYKDYYHHGHFVYALLNKTMSDVKKK